jgi:hypothetical protein
VHADEEDSRSIGHDAPFDVVGQRQRRRSHRET